MNKSSLIFEKKVLIVDDDAASSLRLERQFFDLGAKVEFAGSLNSAMSTLTSSPTFDIAIVDMYIPEEDGKRDFIQRGEQLCSEIRKLNKECIIIGISAHLEQAPLSPVDDLFSAFFFKGDIREDESSALIFETIESLLSVKMFKLPRVFIVYGHDDLLTAEAKNFVQNNLGFPEPIVLKDKPYGGKTVIEKLEAEARLIDFVIVCMSSDDRMDDEVTRARQNVIFEIGFFYGLLRRTRGKVLLLVKGDIDIPSDLSGIVYLDVTNSVESQGERIRREFSAAGFPPLK